MDARSAERNMGFLLCRELRPMKGKLPADEHFPHRGISAGTKVSRRWQMEERIIMTDENGESVEFYVLEETRLHGRNYLLVTDAGEDEDGECYILRDMSRGEDPEAVYEFVEDEAELDGLYRIFSELLDDVDLEK